MPDPEIFRLEPDAEGVRRAAESLFLSISANLRSLLPPSADIRHIGATAIPSCITKGDLDIVVRVDAWDFAEVDRVLEGKFNRNLGSIRTATFAAFEGEDFEPHLGVQLVAVGSEHDDFHVFVDLLRADDDLVQAYNRLKLSYDGTAMDDYRKAKDEFIARVLRRQIDPR